MTAIEQIWFAVGIAGFLLVMQGAIAFIARRIFRNISEDILKVTIGVVLFTLALIRLFTLPPAS